MTKGFEKCINQITKTGNYKSEEKNGVVEVYYHNTVILAYDKTKKIYFCDDRGWNTSSTHRAMSGADEKMKILGYRKVTAQEFIRLTGAVCYVEKR